MSPVKDFTLRNAEQLGMAIRLQRKAKGLSQSGLAELMGVERKWVLRLEAGNPKAELGLILKMFNVLGLRASLGGKDLALPGEGRHVATSRID
jgi:HTH-type transcriptional regulator/antitoxin HipB